MERTVTLKNVQVTETELRDALARLDEMRKKEQTFLCEKRLIVIFDNVERGLLVKTGNGIMLISDYNFNRWCDRYIDLDTPITVKEIERVFKIYVNKIYENVSVAIHNNSDPVYTKG